VRRVVLFLLGLTIGCGRCGPAQGGARVPEVVPPARPRQVTVGYGAPETTAAQSVAIQRPFVERARSKGWEVLIANAEGDAQVQVGQIDYLLSRKVDAMVVVPVSSTAICSAVEKVRKAGVLFLTIDRGTIGCPVDLSILSENWLAGVQAGEAMVRLLAMRHGGSPAGAVLEFQGDLRQNVALQRGEGFHSVVDAYPAIRVIRRETRWDPSRVAAVARVEVTDPAIEGIYLHSDALGLPVLLPILKELGRLHPRGAPGHMIIVGVDGAAVALDGIRQGWVDQSSSQPLPDFALAADYAERLLGGESLEEGLVTKPGAPWSPARLHRSPTGWLLELATTSVTAENVDSPALWANQR